MLQKKDKVLELFLENPGKEMYFREISRFTGLSTTAVKARLRQLEKASLISSEKRANMIVFRSRDTEEYRHLKKLYNVQRLRESGLLDFIVREFHHPAAVVLFGSASRGEDSEKSDLDIFVLCSAKKEPALEGYEKKLGKKINIIAMTAKEFEEAKKKSPEFVNNLINGAVLEGYLKVL